MGRLWIRHCVACEQIQIQKLFLSLSYIYRSRISQAIRAIIVQKTLLMLTDFPTAMYVHCWNL